MLIGGGIGVFVLTISWLFGQRVSKNKIRDTAYECGVKVDEPFFPQFSIRFYTLAILFLLFEVAFVFLFPWVLVHREFMSNELEIIVPMVFFIGNLTLGFVYALTKGALSWRK